MLKNQIYKCNICGNVIEILNPNADSLVCCGEKMELMKEKIEGEGEEKHLPVIEKTENGVRVKVGSVSHPMENDHKIEWIQIIVDGKSYRQFLKTSDKPEIEFLVQGENIQARAYCNLHGLWTNE